MKSAYFICVVLFVLLGAGSVAMSEELNNEATVDGGKPKVQVGKANLRKHPCFPLSEKQKKYLVEAIEDWHFKWDEKVGLLLIPTPKKVFRNNFVSKPMHPIRWSVQYAAACMDSGNPEYQKRAFKILNKVFPFQCTDPENKHYGRWPDYMEIPIPKMRKVDPNSADFLGLSLLNMRIIHDDVIPDDLKKKMDTAIIHCAYSTMRRNCSPGYTNPAFMSAQLTMVVGEAYQIDELKQDGIRKLKEIFDFTKEQGSLNEYSSTGYNMILLYALQGIKNYIVDPEVLALTDELFHMVWKHIAVRWHAPTQQWSGPNSRSYNKDFLPEKYANVFSAALQGKAVEPPEEEKSRSAGLHRKILEIPDDLKHYFTELKEPREVIECFKRPKQVGEPQVIGTTWLSPELSLGTVNRSVMWNQRRNLQAFWGNEKNPSYLRTRFLKNGYDFSTLNFFSVQDKTQVLAALTFCTDGGDRELGQDKIRNERFKAKDLRLRFEFGGVAKAAKIKAPKNLHETASVESGGLKFYIKAPLAVFAGKEGHWETGRNEEAAWLDLVLYQGEKKNFHLPKVAPALIGFGLQVESASDKNPKPNFSGLKADVSDNKLQMSWSDLSLSVSAGPGPKNKLQASYKGSVKGSSRTYLDEEENVK